MSLGIGVFVLFPELRYPHDMSQEPEREVLTIVGASARAAAQSARRAGFAPTAADLFADVDLRRCCPSTRVSDYPQGLYRVCAGPQSGGWMYTGALENHPDLVERLAAVRPLWGNGGEILRRVRDPHQVARALAAWDLASPALAKSARGVPRDGTWLRKPYRSAGGANIAAWTDAAAQTQLDRRYYLQQRVSGLSCSAIYVAAGGSAVLLGVSEQWAGLEWTGAPEFRYAGSIGPVALDPGQRQSFVRIGQCLAEEFGLVGLFGVDAMLAGDRIWTLEVNPRYTASVEVLERACGLNSVALHVAACREGVLPRATAADDHNQCAGKVILYARRRVVVSEALAAWVEPQLDRTWPTYADVPAAGTPIGLRRPILTVLSSGAAPRQVLSELREHAARVEALLCLNRPTAR